MDSSSAPITAARQRVSGAPGPVGPHAALPVGRAREPDTGEEQKFPNYLFFICLYVMSTLFKKTAM